MASSRNVSDVLNQWQPFQIDALGILTLLGAGEIDEALGSLVRWRYSEYLPLLAGHVIAQDAFTKPIPGYILYNISDGIMATDVAGWFCRWSSAQAFSWQSSSLFLSNSATKKTTTGCTLSLLAASVAYGLPLSLALVTRDWWALTNVVAVVVSSLARGVLLGKNRKAIDSATISTRDSDWAREYVKGLLTLPDGRVVTIYAPRGLVTEVLLTKPHVQSPSYHLSRSLAWIAFGTHVIAIGMSSLVNQMLIVVTLLVSSYLVGSRIGCDEMSVGSELGMLRFEEVDEKESRSRAYHRLKLSDSEEDSLIAWNLFPHRSNLKWWGRYRASAAGMKDAKFNNWINGLPLPANFRHTSTVSVGDTREL